MLCAVNHESQLMYSALCYEEGHNRRTQHILKVYALAKLLGEKEGLLPEEQQILRAAAILHDIPIKYCKAIYSGDASQENQKKEAPQLATRFLQEADYQLSYIPQIIELIVNHHDYDGPRNRILQLLMEADLIVNCYESSPSGERVDWIRAQFQTAPGKELFEIFLKGAAIE